MFESWSMNILTLVVGITLTWFAIWANSCDKEKRSEILRGLKFGFGLQFVVLVLVVVGISLLLWAIVASRTHHLVSNSSGDVEWDAIRSSILASSPRLVEPRPVVTNEQLWDHITESRIDLGEEPKDEPAEESEPKGRPAWVDNPPKRVGDVHRVVVASDPFTTIDECFEQLEGRFPEEVRNRLAKLVPKDESSLVGSASLAAFGVSLEYIMREICQYQFSEVVESSVGPMRRVHVLMEFTPAIEKHLLASWQSHLQRHRLISVAQIAGFVLAALALVYGLLQIDTWTRGYYTRRLLLGVPAAILALVAILVLLNVA